MGRPYRATIPFLLGTQGTAFGVALGYRMSPFQGEERRATQSDRPANTRRGTARPRCADSFLSVTAMANHTGATDLGLNIPRAESRLSVDDEFLWFAQNGLAYRSR